VPNASRSDMHYSVAVAIWLLICRAAAPASAGITVSEHLILTTNVNLCKN